MQGPDSQFQRYSEMVTSYNFPEIFGLKSGSFTDLPVAKHQILHQREIAKQETSI